MKKESVGRKEKWRKVSGEGGERLLGGGRFIINVMINVIVFFLLSNSFKIFSVLSSTLLQHSIFEASKRIFWSDVQNTSTTE